MLITDLIKMGRIESFDNSVPPLFSDEEWTIWFNEAEAEACIRKQLIRENYSVPLCQFDIQPNIRDYPLDPRMLEIVYASLIYWGATGSLPWPLGMTSDAEMDGYRPFWRSLPYRPMAVIQRDTQLGVDCLPNAQYQLNVEGWRLPMWQMGLGASFSGTISGTTLTVNQMNSGVIADNAIISGLQIATGTTIVTQLTGLTGQAGTYQLSTSQNIDDIIEMYTDGAIVEVLASGTLTLTGGTSGQVNQVLVNGIDILGGAVAFDTSLSKTAADVVAQITANTNRYVVSNVGAVITITDLAGTGCMHNGYTVSANTTTITTSATAFAGGVDAVTIAPEISPTHHRHLVKWALHRAYQKPDSETMNPDKSAKALQEFEDYFGPRPDADLRKKQNRGTPHRNMCYG